MFRMKWLAKKGKPTLRKVFQVVNDNLLPELLVRLDVNTKSEKKLHFIDLPEAYPRRIKNQTRTLFI